MNLGSSTEDIAFLIILFLALIFIIPLLLGLSGLVLRLLGLKSGGWQLVLIILFFGGLIIGSSLYLDTVGQTVTGVVYEKNEQIDLRIQGDWRYQFDATTRYRLDGQLPATDLLVAMDDSSVRLRLTEAQFDELTTNTPVALKVLPVWRSLTLVRLASSSTRQWVPWGWLAGAAVLVAGGWLAYKLAQTGTAALIIISGMVITGLFTYPALSVYRTWQERDSLAARPLRAQGTVLEKTRITRIDPLPCETDCSNEWDTEFDVPQQYEIIKISYVPQGKQEAVTAVASADLGSVQLEKGGSVSIAYAPDAPRAVRIMDASVSHIWRNAIGFVREMGLTLIILAAFIGGWVLLGRLFSWAIRRRGQAARA
jgi:hypothetical protein